MESSIVTAATDRWIRLGAVAEAIAFSRTLSLGGDWYGCCWNSCPEYDGAKAKWLHYEHCNLDLIYMLNRITLISRHVNFENVERNRGYLELRWQIADITELWFEMWVIDVINSVESGNTISRKIEKRSREGIKILKFELLASTPLRSEISLRVLI